MVFNQTTEKAGLIMVEKAPVVDPVLADIMKSEKDPFEKIDMDTPSSKGIWTMGVIPVENYDILKHGRPARLECGHFTMTKALKRAQCPRCGEMIRAGYDYDSFRHHGAPDEFSWPGDPFQLIHEGNNENCDLIKKTFVV